jgi:serine/threonine protein kinase/formylglycine-generating enzyme required for sulfatase activity
MTEMSLAEAIFFAALEKGSPQERAAYLDAACGPDAALRDRVERLLAAHAQVGNFLEQSAAPRDPTSADALRPTEADGGASAGAGVGLVLAGRYKLLEAIGAGGMGAVWMAQQTEPVKRRVAVKLIKPGMGSKQVLARFEAERQALALMDHPNIARVFDGGATPDGRPYFVMELVKGVPITRYCDEHRLTPRQRLELFVQVCAAIQHAHQKGVIHRDSKPSNVLVALYDDRPVVKVIDFGVAKAVGQQLTEETLVTGFGAVIGTLEYMSPEQASFNNLDIDTRSDVYALGVLLYELLAGSPPFSRKDLERAGILEMLRLIREQEPLRPSTRLSTAEGLPTLAAERGMEPGKLTRLLRGELDWIVMKCLEKDRNRRYESANALALDVQHYLRDEPVQAGPPSQTYRLQKFLRRNRKPALAGAVLAVLAVLVGLGIHSQVQEVKSATQAAGLVQSLARADIAQVPGIIDQLAAYRRWTDPLLRAACAQAESTGQQATTQAEKTRQARQQLHASLALLPVDDGQVPYLAKRLLDAEANELLVLRDALARHKGKLVEKLWRVVERPARGKEGQRLRAAAALAAYDPHGLGWAQVQDQVADDFVRVPAVYLALWMQALRDAQPHLQKPLVAVFRNGQRPETERERATDILADYVADQPAVLADLLLDADAKQFAVIYARFQEQEERGLPALRGAIDKKLPPDATEDAKEALAKRQANAAVVLLRRNQPAKVWPLLKRGPAPDDPRLRSYLIHRLFPLGADAQAIIQHLDEEPDVSIGRALLLALGEFDEAALPAEVRQTLLPRLQDIYRTEADPGLHAAAEWLLRQWKQEEWLKRVNDEWTKTKAKREGWWETGKDRAEAPSSPSTTRHSPRTAAQWYVNGQGQTMVVIPGPVAFRMGSPEAEAGRNPTDEVQHQKRIGRTFALAATPVTLEQYRKFDARYGIGEIETWVKTDDSPVIRTSWFQAAAYCNWLSQQEGLPESEWCYEPLPALPGLTGSSVGLLAGLGGPLAASCGLFPGRTEPQYEAGMKLARKYLQRQGYRLPTEAELEYACRAGAATSRSYGETEELLDKYARYGKNSQDHTWPVGSKKPNDFGLFDMHGNVWNWCQERYQDYRLGEGRQLSEDIEDTLDVTIQVPRVLRGGSFTARARYVRCAHRDTIAPGIHDDNISFRPARTVP